MYEEADESWQGPVAILPAAMAEKVTPGGMAWMAAKPCQQPLTADGVKRPVKVGSVSSPMQEAAIRLLDAIYVSNLPHC
jgi:hypothetical protein